MPTQKFFTDDFGLPLTMNPNFEDLSCDMIFGQAPPPLELDAASSQPCFAVHCNLAEEEPTACPMVKTAPAKGQPAPVAALNTGDSLPDAIDAEVVPQPPNQSGGNSTSQASLRSVEHVSASDWGR